MATRLSKRSRAGRKAAITRYARKHGTSRAIARRAIVLRRTGSQRKRRRRIGLAVRKLMKRGLSLAEARFANRNRRAFVAKFHARVKRL